MFKTYRRNLPEMEDRILDELGPRDLVSAKQVCRDWCIVVRRYVRQQGASKVPFLMEQAFLEPVKTYATVKLPFPVRDLTINDKKRKTKKRQQGDVYILGEKGIVQLNAATLQVVKRMDIEVSEEDTREFPWIAKDEALNGDMHVNVGRTGRDFEVKINRSPTLRYKTSGSDNHLVCLGKKRRTLLKNSNATSMHTSLTEKIPKESLRNYQLYGLIHDIVQISDDMCLFSRCIPSDEEEEKQGWSKIFVVKRNKFCPCGNDIIKPTLIATLPMEYVKLRVIGTRVFCHGYGRGISYNDGYYRRGLCDHIIVWDIWNPASLETAQENDPSGRISVSGDSSKVKGHKTKKKMEGEPKRLRCHGMRLRSSVGQEQG